MTIIDLEHPVSTSSSLGSGALLRQALSRVRTTVRSVVVRLYKHRH
jgi:hypothetical protein